MTESRMQGFAAGRYAAIDIGTVTCRMLVADVDAAGAIHEVDREYAITNLGEGVDATGMLLPAAIDRTVETVEGYCAVRDRLAEQGAPIAKTIAVATSASRYLTMNAWWVSALCRPDRLTWAAKPGVASSREVRTVAPKMVSARRCVTCVIAIPCNSQKVPVGTE